LLLLLLAFVACKKEEADPWAYLEDGRSIVVRDLPGDTNGAMGETADGKTKKGFDTFLFRLADQKQIWLRNAEDSARWFKTDEWDLAFTGPYNSEIFVNNGSDRFNPAHKYGSAGTMRAVFVLKPYSEVHGPPADEELESSRVSKIGWADFPTEQPGWYTYSLATHIMVPIKNKTYLLRLAGGRHAKLELVNAYQGNPPAVTNLNWPAPYFTFRYLIFDN